jgi:outer membrane protein assembly factor BamB
MAEITTKLQNNPDAADALALRGALKLHEGNDTEALADLKRAYELQPTDDARALIVGRVLEGLRSDPARYLGYRDEVRELIQNPEESLAFLMLTAGAANTPEARLDAFRDSLELARTLGGELELQKLGEAHRVRGDAWLRARIEELTKHAQPDELAAWDKLLEHELPKTLEGLSPESRRQVLSSFPAFPSVENALADLLGKGSEKGFSLQDALLVKRLRTSKNTELAGFATLALAESYFAQGRETEAWPLALDLRKNWPSLIPEHWQNLKPPEAALWPEGKLEAHFRQRRVAVLPEIPITAGRIKDSPYANWSFSIDQQSRRLLARDENGMEKWHLDLGETNGPILDLDEISIDISGHVGVLVQKTHFAVFDLLSRKHTASVLWTEALMDGGINLDEVYRLEQFQRNRLIFGAGLPVVGDHFGWVTLIGEELIVYQVGERVIAADALTGKPRWIRENVRSQSRIFGDADRIAVIAPDATSALVLKTLDGEILATKPLPEPRSQIAFDKLNLVAWTSTKSEKSLESRDLETGALQWKILCPEGTTLRNMNAEELAVFQPDGRFLVVSLADGAVKVDAKLELGQEKHAHEIRRLANCYLVLPARSDPNRNPFVLDVPVDGMVQAFDRSSGKLLWKTKVDDQALEQLPPYNSPVVVFNKRREPGPGVGGFIENNPFRVKLLDVRTGEVVYEHNQLQNVSPWGLRILPSENKATVTFFEAVIEVEAVKEPQDNPQS